ncbi:low temperature requirement protein LtrA [Agromyces flavus]|nr:low temperature requirement protein A [Agromyces flavus]MCP2366791.1 low temperature requirement protein LtrA [Agromyces flavus]GGI45377.1 membrane protein [Agromyces flavus]
MAFGLRPDVLRPADTERAQRVTYVELFFDLVFVFGLNQLAAYLYENQTPLGALEGVIMVIALWWAWVSTTWVTNWLDPVKLPVRVTVIGFTFLAFLMSAAIAEAFGDRAWTFALAYILLKLGRAVFMVWATSRHSADVSHDFGNVLIWAIPGSALWITGALLPLPLQLPFWAAALGLELTGSILGYPVPGRGRMEIGRWDVSGAHIAERAALFVLIALGEGLLVTGFEFASEESSTERVIAVVAAFVAAAACWWIYFDHGERIGSEAIEAADTPGRMARTAYSWVHLLIVAGIVLLGVGDKEVLGHPHEQSVAAVVTVLGGPMLFLVGTVLFRRVLERRWIRAQLAGIAGVVIVAAFSPFLDPLSTGSLATLVLVATAAGETVERMARRAPEGG